MLLQIKEALQFVYEEKKLNDLSFFLFFVVKGTTSFFLWGSDVNKEFMI